MSEIDWKAKCEEVSRLAIDAVTGVGRSRMDLLRDKAQDILRLASPPKPKRWPGWPEDPVVDRMGGYWRFHTGMVTRSYDGRMMHHIRFIWPDSMPFAEAVAEWNRVCDAVAGVWRKRGRIVNKEQVEALAKDIVEFFYEFDCFIPGPHCNTYAGAMKMKGGTIAQVANIIRRHVPPAPDARELAERIGFDDFSRVNRERAEVWNGDNPPPIEFAAMELAGEVGELCNAIKKSVRLKHGMVGGSVDMQNIADELGDVVICADLIAARFGINLGAAVASKFNKTSEKHGFPHRVAAIIEESRHE